MAIWRWNASAVRTQPAILSPEELSRADDMAPRWLTHFAVADPAAAAERAEALGGSVLLAPSADFRDGRMALIADPAGALLVLHQWPEAGGSMK